MKDDWKGVGRHPMPGIFHLCLQSAGSSIVRTSQSIQTSGSVDRVNAMALLRDFDLLLEGERTQ